MKEIDLSNALPYLRHFQAIARHKNLRRAAEEIHLSPPALTQSLKQIEQILGFSLCVRTRREFKLTPEGEQLLQATNSAFFELSRFTDHVVKKNNTGGHFCIGIIDGFNHPRYLELIQEVGKKFPDAYLSIMVFPSEEIIKRVNSGDLDAGFGIFNERSKSLTYCKIGEEHLSYFISNKHPLARFEKLNHEDLLGKRSVWFDNESKSKIEIEHSIFKESPSNLLKISAFTNNESVAIQLLKTGKFIVPLPNTFANSALAHGCKEIKISKGPKILNQEFVFNSKLTGSALKDFFIQQLTKLKL